MKPKDHTLLKWIMTSNTFWQSLVDKCEPSTKRYLDDYVKTLVKKDSGGMFAIDKWSNWDISSHLEGRCAPIFCPSGITLVDQLEMEGVSRDQRFDMLIEMMGRNAISIENGKISIKGPYKEYDDSDNKLAYLGTVNWNDNRIAMPGCDVVDKKDFQGWFMPHFISFDKSGISKDIFINVTNGGGNMGECVSARDFINFGYIRTGFDGVLFNSRDVDICTLMNEDSISKMLTSTLSKNPGKRVISNGHIKYPFGHVENFTVNGGLSLILGDEGLKLTSCKNFPERVENILYLEDLYDLKSFDELSKDVGGLVLERVRMNEGLMFPSGMHVRHNVKLIDMDPKCLVRLAHSDIVIDGIIVCEYYSGTLDHLRELVEKYGWEE